MKKAKRNMTYLDSVHFYGRIWGWAAAALIFAFPFVTALIFQAWPNMSGVLKGTLAVAPIFWTVGVIEVFTYVPMLGAGSSYLGFVTGNLSNLKVPCALACMEGAEVKPGTEEGEIISTISTAVSSIVTTGIIIIGVCLIIPLTPVLQSEFLQPAFANILPALFGALGVVYISKNWKIAVVPAVLMLVLFISVPALNAGTVGIMVPVGAIVAIAASRFMYKKGWLGEVSKVPAVTGDDDPETVIEAAEETGKENSFSDTANEEESSGDAADSSAAYDAATEETGKSENGDKDDVTAFKTNAEDGKNRKEK